LGTENEIVVVAADGAVVARWTLGATGRPDLAAVDELVRLRLCARRSGHTVELHNPSTELCELLDLAGLSLDDRGEAPPMGTAPPRWVDIPDPKKGEPPW
jgi:hypothetical protein